MKKTGLSACSPVQLRALVWALKRDRYFHRHFGGYWGQYERDGLLAAGTFGQRTIEALGKRGWVVFTAWKLTRRGVQFPIEAKVVSRLYLTTKAGYPNEQQSAPLSEPTPIEPQLSLFP